MMIYAQIKNGKVKNIVVVDEDSPIDALSAGYDYFLRTDNLDQVVGVNFSYDGQTFTPPPPPEIEILDEE